MTNGQKWAFIPQPRPGKLVEDIVSFEYWVDSVEYSDSPTLDVYHPANKPIAAYTGTEVILNLDAMGISGKIYAGHS